MQATAKILIPTKSGSAEADRMTMYIFFAVRKKNILKDV